MKIPETEIRWHHILLLAILAAVLIFGFSLNKQVKVNKANIQAIVNVLVQSGIVKQQPPQTLLQPTEKEKKDGKQQ